MTISRGTGTSALKERPMVNIEHYSFTNYADFHFEDQINRGIVGVIDFKRIGQLGIYAHRNGSVIEVDRKLSSLLGNICSIPGVEMASVTYRTIRVHKDMSMSWTEIKDQVVQAIAKSLNISLDDLRVTDSNKNA